MTREEFKKKFNEVKKMEFWEDTICNYKKISESFIQEFVKLSKSSLNIKFNNNNSLYKYSRADIYSIENLKNSNLFFKFAGKFSDGFDSLFEIDNISKKILNNLFKKKLGVELEKIVQRDCLVTCFTDTNLNNKMWKEYANSHSGFCQEYDLKELQRE